MANKKRSKRGTGRRATKRANIREVQQSAQKTTANKYHGVTAHYMLRITLRSDLCPGSGDGFSSGIDTDVCFDAQGIPFIPGRRLKGCLRESARLITNNSNRASNIIDLIFGKAGADEGGAISVANATMCDSRSYGSIDATLNCYTYTRAQTKMDRKTGTVTDGTLRFIRVVKHYQENGTETQFEAEVRLEHARFNSKDEARAARDLLRDAVRGLRNIGQSRNRGFGAVSCELISREQSAKNRDLQESYVISSVDDVTEVLSYRVRLDSPLMLALQSGSRSLGYVPGTSVLGFFAGRMRNREDFDQLFLSGRVRFSPRYPVDDEGNRCVPCAPFIAKIKGGNRDGALMNALTYVQKLGETPKPLRDGFMSPATWNPVETKSEIVYHHSTGSDGTKATLYTQECISMGQELAGFIECPKEFAEDFKRELVWDQLTFGRSKSAQYSRCSLVNATHDYSHMRDKLNIESGEHYALLFDSDALIEGEDGCFTTSYESLKRQLAKVTSATGSWFEACDAELKNERHPCSSLSVRTITGYNAKWNQKKPHVRAIAAGSCLVFKATASAHDVPTVMHIGERLAEGFGCVLLLDLSKVVPTNAQKRGGEPLHTTQSLNELARLNAIAYAEEAQSRFFSDSDHGSSFIGRLTLMVDESQSRDELIRRLESIKSDSKRNAALTLVDELCHRLTTPTWPLEKECLQLLLTLEKYYAKQAKTREGSE